MSLLKGADELLEIDLVQLKEELSKHGIVVCPVRGCDQDFRSFWGLKYHLKQTKHESSTERMFNCKQCNLMFQSQIALRQHGMAEHSGGKREKSLSCSSSKEKGSFHHESSAEKRGTQTNAGITNGDRSSSKVKSNMDLLVNETVSKNSSELKGGLQESSTCSEKDSTKLAGVPKTTKAQQRKTSGNANARRKNADNFASENLQTDVETLNSTKGASISKAKSIGESEVKTPVCAVTATRASTRMRTPRKTFYEELIENERAYSTSRKRGVKRKANTYDRLSDEERETVASNKNATETGKKGEGRPKRTTKENDMHPGESAVKRKNERKKVAQESTITAKEEKKGDGAKSDAKDENKENDKNKPAKKVTGRKSEEGSRKSEEDDNENEAVTKKKTGRGKRSSCSELVMLKKYLRTRQKLTCKNKGCTAKFGTANGYLAHKKTCGVKEEEREKFVCDVCGKEYISMPGLAYHVKTKHAQTTESDHSGENDKETEEPEVTESGRTRRKAASRAMSKVQRLVTAQTDEIKPGEADPQKRKATFKTSELDELLTMTPGRVISKGLEDKWCDALKTNMQIVCPCKGCGETFTSISSVKEHLECCEKAFSYKCLACNRMFGGQFSARNHVKHWHVGYTPGGKDKSDSSDADFEVISSEESDDVEIEEIEEDDSDLDENFDEAEEIFVWDDKRKKYKKAKHKKPVPGLTKIKVGGEADSDVYAATEKWRQKVHKHKELFSNLRPCVSYWSKVGVSESNQYVPEAAASPQFTIEREGDDSGSQQNIQLPLFGSTSKEDSFIYGDVTFNVGGPVWAMDWCPVPDTIKTADQFLAISTHRSLDQVHFIHKTISSKGLVQLWHVGQLKVDSASSGSKPTLSLGIAHNYGTIWEISWCPSGTWEPTSSKKNQDDLPRLGLMALACSDGLVRILSIPWPSQLFSAIELGQAGIQSSTSSVIMHATPHAVLMPCALGVAYDGQCGQAWCVKWHPHSMHDKIAAGFSDGTVAIWKLSTESVLLKEPVADDGRTFRLFPFLHVTTNSSVIRDLAWCPQDPNIFVTGGYDRQYKLWNMKTPHLSITSLKRGIPTEIRWPQNFGNIVSSEEDCFQTARCPNIVRKISFMGDKLTITYHNSTIWTVSLSDWCKLLACGDAAGEVEAVYLRHCNKKYPKFVIYRVCVENLHQHSLQDENENFSREQEGTTGSKDLETRHLSQESTVDHEPRSYSTKEILQNHKLVFRDANTLEFGRTVNKSDRGVKPDSMQSVSFESLYNPQAIHKVRFNPNKQAFSWLASGGAAGLARLHLVKQVT